jgi:hypothetical protein
MFWFRYILTLTTLLATLAGGVAGVAWSGWSANPIAPDNVLVVSDGLMAPGRFDGVARAFVTTGNRLSVQRLVARADLPDGPSRWIHYVPHGVFYWRYPATSAGQAARLPARLQLSPQLGLGPLMSAGSIFVVRTDDQFVAVDLEGIRVDGRYELEPARRGWLAGQLGDRRAVYLADVSPRQYNELRAELSAGGWPVGPLVAWKFGVEGNPRSAQEGAARLKGDLGNHLVLAVVGRMKDNQPTCGFGPADRPIVKTITCPAGLAGSGP